MLTQVQHQVSKGGKPPLQVCHHRLCLTWCRYVLWLLGDEDSLDNSSAPLAEQVCQVSYKQGDVTAIDWTQSSDGLMVADACGHVSMYETLAAGTGFSAPLPDRQLFWQVYLHAMHALGSISCWAAVSNVLHKTGGLVQVLVSWASACFGKVRAQRRRRS